MKWCTARNPFSTACRGRVAEVCQPARLLRLDVRLPGQKLLFMGNEFAQGREWNHDTSLDWHLLEGADNWHHGVQRLVRDLNLTYRHHKALHELDFDPYGFEWLVVDDHERSVFVFARRDKAGNGSSSPATSRQCRVNTTASALTSRANGAKFSIPTPCITTAAMRVTAGWCRAMPLKAMAVRTP